MARVRASNELKKMSILYVEDEEFVRESFTNLLTRNIQSVHIACDGIEGLDLYKKHHIDIVISDINMPKMNGLEMAKQIKEINSESTIVFTTAFGDNENLQKSIDIGVDGYLIKPIDINKVFTKLNSLAKQINSKNEAERYSQLLKVVLDEQREGVVLLDENLDIKIYNNSFKNICTRVNEHKPNSIDDIFQFCRHFNTDKYIDRDWFENIDEKKDITLTCTKDENQTKYFQAILKKVKDYIVFSLTDITDLKQETTKLKAEILLDKLTEIYNRKVIDVIFDELKNTDIYMILLDIDNFKLINDKHGHIVGDEVLKVLAKMLKTSLRDNDIVIRWGGEEFVILLKTVQSLETAKTIAEGLRSKITTLKVENIDSFSCSFGVAKKYISSIDDIDELFGKADKLLYKAKENGKNRVEG